MLGHIATYEPFPLTEEDTKIQIPLMKKYFRIILSTLLEDYQEGVRTGFQGVEVHVPVKVKVQY